MRQQYQTQMPRVQALLNREQRILAECQASHHEYTSDIERRIASINRHLKGSCKPS